MSGAGAGAVLAVRDLAVRAAEGRALVEGVSLAVAPGERLGVVGESGAGKTLLMRACLGLLPVGMACEAAKLSLAGTDVRTLAPRAQARLLGTRVGFVPQNTMEYLHPLMRVRDQMTDGYRTHHPEASRASALERARELLAACGIDDPDRVLAARPAELSGGMRQRVNVACALMGDPALVVADEPTAALDTMVARQVIDLMGRLAQERGAALVMVSHNLGMVRACCDELVVMRAGRVVEAGAARAVFAAPRCAYTRELVAAVPSLDDARAGRAREGVGASEGVAMGAEVGRSGAREHADGALACEPACAAAPLLEARAVSKRFRTASRGQVVAVDGVSLALRPGQTVAVVGASGSGKSTLGALLGGLLAPDAGSVLFAGEDVARLRGRDARAFRRAVQFVFQDPVASINPTFTVAQALADVQHVLFAGRKRAEVRDRARAMLERVGLTPDEVLGRRARELSGGQCQRVAIARALLAEPQVLVCDECTSALDATVQAQVCDLLRDLQRELGCAYVVVSHDMGVVARMADEVLVMRAGSVVERGSAARVLRTPEHPYTQALVAAAFEQAGDPAGEGAR